MYSRTFFPFVAAVVFTLALPSAASAQGAERAEALARMPVKEVTVFKDGHAFMLHEGSMPVSEDGSVRLDYVPMPVLGTFWPYSATRNVKLAAVTASTRRVTANHTALNVIELLEANPGAQVTVIEVDNRVHEGELVGRPRPSEQERERVPPTPGQPLPPPVKSNMVLLKTQVGTIALPVERIQTVTFKGDYKSVLPEEENRNLLSLKLDWPNNRPAKTADVGMIYLQKGIRWIPSYRVTIDGKGSAIVKLQATLINEMVDLKDVTANLVIGVPTFAFKDTQDPIGLQQVLAQLSPYFEANSRVGGQLSNSIMTQSRFGERGGGFGGGAAAPAPPEVPEIGGSTKNEDLFVFTVKHVTLKKGERMVLPVAEYALKYRDVYTLDVPFAPPREIRANSGLSQEQQAELTRLINAPKVMHKLRLTNSANHPMTTAPALIMNGDRVIAQGLMTYTPLKSDVDLSLTTAVDIGVKKSEKEAGRTPNAVEWQGNRYGRVDMTGTITLTNSRGTPVEVEVNRYVLGLADSADNNGQVTMLNAFEEGAQATDSDLPYWWRWYNWPYWWHHFNGLGQFQWKVKLDPGKSQTLGYKWHYFWQ